MCAFNIRLTAITVVSAAWPLFASAALGQEMVEPRQLVRVSLNNADGVYYEGDLLRVTVESDIDVFVYCIYHQADGEAVLLGPNKLRRANRVKAGEKVDPIGKSVEISAPYGVEILQVLTAVRPLPEFDRLLDPPAAGRPTRPTTLIDQWCERLVEAKELLLEYRFDLNTMPKENKPSE